MDNTFTLKNGGLAMFEWLPAEYYCKVGEIDTSAGYPHANFTIHIAANPVRARYEINVARFRGIFVGGQGSGTAAYSVLRKATLTQSSGKKTRKMLQLFRNGPLRQKRPARQPPRSKWTATWQWRRRRLPIENSR